MQRRRGYESCTSSETSLSEFRPRIETFIELAEKFTDKELNEILDKLKKAPKQQDLLSAYLRLTGYTEGSEILPVGKSHSVIRSTCIFSCISIRLLQKEYLNQYLLPVSRITDTGSFREPVKKLSEAQSEAYESVKVAIQ